MHKATRFPTGSQITMEKKKEKRNKEIKKGLLVWGVLAQRRWWRANKEIDNGCLLMVIQVTPHTLKGLTNNSVLT